MSGDQLFRVQVEANNSNTTLLIDAGASVSIISCCFGAKIGSEVQQIERTTFIKGIGVNSLSPVGKIEVRLQFGSTDFREKFIVLKDCPYELLGGLQFFRQANLFIDFRRKEPKIVSDVYQLHLDISVQSSANVVTARSENQVRVEHRTEAILRVQIPRGGIQAVQQNSRNELQVARTVMNVVGGSGIVSVANPILSPIALLHNAKIG